VSLERTRSGRTNGREAVTGPFRLLEGAEYDAARTAANQTNRVFAKTVGTNAGTNFQRWKFVPARTPTADAPCCGTRPAHRARKFVAVHLRSARATSLTLNSVGESMGSSEAAFSGPIITFALLPLSNFKDLEVPLSKERVADWWETTYFPPRRFPTSAIIVYLDQ